PPAHAVPTAYTGRVCCWVTRSGEPSQPARPSSFPRTRRTSASRSSRPSPPVNIAQDLEADGCALVEPDTQEGITRLLTRWLALTPSQQAEMASRAHDSFLRSYDMRRNAEAILRVFEKPGTEEAGQIAPLNPSPQAGGGPRLPEAR